jgi:2-C-methyl-D-erythritol 4-phosphate cytidylyltransferase
MTVRVAVIVAAGGTADRFGHAGGKQLAPVLGRPLLSWTLEALDGPPVGLVVVVCHPDRVSEYERLAIRPLALGRPAVAVAGGATRQESVANGLAAVPDSFAYVAVHDGARPLVARATLETAVERLDRGGVDGVIAGHPSYDTLKRVEGRRVVDTPDRSQFWVAQTPQVFLATSLRDAHASAQCHGVAATDDSALVETWGGSVEMIGAPRDNIKVTTADDVRFVEAALGYRRKAGGA